MLRHKIKKKKRLKVNLKALFTKRNILYFVLVFSFGIFLIYLDFFQFNPSIQTSADTNEELFDQANIMIKNLQNELLNTHLKAWELDAEGAEFYNKSNLIILNRFTMTRLSKDAKPITTISGDKASLNNKTKNITLNGNVIIVQPDKMTIKGEVFHWNNDTKLITSPEKVVVHQAGKGVVSGIGFEATHDLENITFHKQTSGVIIQ